MSRHIKQSDHQSWIKEEENQLLLQHFAQNLNLFLSKNKYFAPIFNATDVKCNLSNFFRKHYLVVQSDLNTMPRHKEKKFLLRNKKFYNQLEPKRQPTKIRSSKANDKKTKDQTASIYLMHVSHVILLSY